MLSSIKSGKELKRHAGRIIATLSAIRGAMTEDKGINPSSPNPERAIDHLERLESLVERLRQRLEEEDG